MLRVHRIMVVLALLAVPFSGFCQVDPTYWTVFGESGAMAVSSKGYPPKEKYEASMFDQKGTTFFLKPGAETTCDIRVMLPKGKSLAQLLAALKKEKPQNLKHRQEDMGVFRFYYDRDESGKLLVDAKHPWPATLTDEPVWCEPKEYMFQIDGENDAWLSCGATWDEKLKPELGQIFRSAPKGARIYCTFSVAYQYLTPGGEIENKWDAERQKWIPVESTGLLGFVFSDPIAACTIEFK